MRRLIIVAMVALITVFSFGIVSYAAENQDQENTAANVELTLDEAITNALKNSFKIQQSKLDVDRANEVRDKAWDNFGYLVDTYKSSQDLYMGIPDNGNDNSFFYAMTADRAAYIQKKAYEISQDAITLQVTRNYYDIIKYQQDLDTDKLALEIADRAYKVAKIKNQLGMATTADVESKKTELEGAKTLLESAQANLENAYQSLNKLMGKKEDLRPQMVTSVDYEKKDIPSLDAEIIRAMNPNQNPYLWSKKEGYELKKYSWTTTEPQEAGKVDIDKEKLTYEEARVETRNKMNELYNNLKTLEAAYASATQALATAELGLKNAQALYETGMITRDDLLNAENSVVKAKGELLSKKIDYSLCKISFEKPWLTFLT